ncbi:DUF6769 family protein [Sunxiuqinia elliptica]|uniref:Uncharacterized protein n=1 Tax=Sunxiuqinia elliptica TaxID=655355 RepID=A0A1I2J2W8_9BACT|nr:DUF6769 family protein [Sunxiuqinia elliptica]SFF48350.1 hypothetical protein SAMN05216283_107130 [Sunxiuqinia elliptica]
MKNVFLCFSLKRMHSKFKHIGTLFMWISMLIILGHSIIPHHHHAETAACEHECLHAEAGSVVNQMPAFNNAFGSTLCEASHGNQGCEACNFSIEATSALSKLIIDYTYLSGTSLLHLIFPQEQLVVVDVWNNHYSFDFYHQTSSRAPPVLA